MNQKNKAPVFVIGLLCAITALCILLTVNFNRAKTEPARINISTSLYPVYVAAINVTKGVDGVSIENLTGNMSGCAHDYQLTTGNMKTLQASDVLIINGMEMEEFLEGGLASVPNVAVINSGEGIELPDFAIEEHEHTEEEEQEHEHEHVNGHIWLNPDLYCKQVQNIADALALLYPADAAKFLENSQAYQAEVKAKAEELKTAVSDLPKKVIIFHDSLEYLAEYLGFVPLKTVEMDTDITPSTGEITDAIAIGRAQGAAFVLCEKQFESSAAASVAKDLGIPLIVLDSGVTGSGGGEAYLDMLEATRCKMQEVRSKNLS
ncbi:MAG: metal ABC transporter substrate-binding protein [Oscillospiraceae bacterium]|nr:metal ABC transporter substrate-binding protein [Oscillospiraceae bacterium]